MVTDEGAILPHHRRGEKLESRRGGDHLRHPQPHGVLRRAGCLLLHRHPVHHRQERRRRLHRPVVPRQLLHARSPGQAYWQPHNRSSGRRVQTWAGAPTVGSGSLTRGGGIYFSNTDGLPENDDDFSEGKIGSRGRLARPHGPSPTASSSGSWVARAASSTPTTRVRAGSATAGPTTWRVTSTTSSSAPTTADSSWATTASSSATSAPSKDKTGG